LVRSRIGDPVRATRELGFKAEVELERGLQDLIAWRRGHILAHRAMN